MRAVPNVAPASCAPSSPAALLLSGARGRGGRIRPRSAVLRERGFTLLEVLVVLVIGGLLVGLASLSFSRNPHNDLTEEAQRLALIFETAGDEAQLRDAPLEWRPVAGGYRFEIQTDGRWRPIADELLGPRHWQIPVTGVSIHYPDDAHDRRVETVDFGTESISRPVTVTLYSDYGSISIGTDGSGRFAVLNGEGS